MYYSFRMSYTKLTENFPILVLEFCGHKLPLKRLGSVFASLRFGPSNVFLNEETWLRMKSVEQLIVQSATRKIQHAWRKYIMGKIKWFSWVNLFTFLFYFLLRERKTTPGSNPNSN
jgi:hypothetical protein